MTSSGAGETIEGNNNEKAAVRENEGDQNPNPNRSQGVGGTGSSIKQARKKAPVFDGPEVPPPCEVCGKVFPSWKSLFGHMRSHPERSWRGVKPPPVFTPPPSPKGAEDAAATLLQIATAENKVAGTDDSIINDNNIVVESSGSTSRGALAADFDLNDPMEEEDTPPTPKRQRTFDLNMPAPEEDDDEEADH